MSTSSFRSVARRPQLSQSFQRRLPHAHRYHATRINASSTQTRAESTVNPDEIALFSKLSSQWWDEQGECKMLHRMNPVRVQFIREKMLEMQREDTDTDAQLDHPKALAGLKILDVGCGGGLLCESLTRLGGLTLGIDASASNVAIASLHAAADPGLRLIPGPFVPTTTPARTSNLTYEHTSAEELLARGGPAQFDVVCSMEVLEHVDNPRTFLSTCAQLVKPGGHLFLSTISRTPLAYALTILAAEHVLRLVTPGTHTYAKYVRPDELLGFFQGFCCPSPGVLGDGGAGRPWISRLYNGAPARTEAETRGIVYVPWTGAWALVPRGSPGARWGEGCNYLLWVRRPLE